MRSNRFLASLALSLPLFASCAERPGDDAGQDGSKHDHDALQAPVPASAAPMAALDASGRLANRAVWSARAATDGTSDGTVATSAKAPRRSYFTFEAPGPGAFYLQKLVVTPVGCDVRRLGTRLFGGRLAVDGRLESWQRLETFEVLRLGAKQRLLIALEGDEDVPCGDVELLLAARFLETKADLDWERLGGGDVDAIPQPGPIPAPGPTPEPGPIPAPGPNPEPDPSPGPAPIPGPQPVPDPGPGPSPTPEPVPVPVPVPVPTPGGDPCPTTGPTASDPAVMSATVRVYGQRAGGSTCSTTFTWRLADLVRRDPARQCQYPEIKLVSMTTPPLVKVQAAGGVLDLNLAWLKLETEAERNAVLATLRQGGGVDLVAPVPHGRPEAERCVVPGAPTAPKLESDLDLTLFRGDPREQCLGGTEALSQLEFADPTHDFTVDYTRPEDGDAHFRFTWQWPAANAAAATPVRIRAYDRRIRVFVGAWMPATPVGGGRFAAEVSGADAAAALAAEGDLELVIADGRRGDVPDSCQRALLFPYARFYLDPRFAASFRNERP